MGACVEVAVGLPVWGTYHYVTPKDSAVAVGSRVLVPFGGRGVTGVVVRDGVAPTEEHQLREIREVLDEIPALDRAMVELCLWVADYYQAPPGEVFRLALPVGTQVASARRVALSEKGRAAMSGGASGALPPRLWRLAADLAPHQRPVAWKGSNADLAALIEAGLVCESEARKDARVKARSVTTVALARELGDDDRAALARAPKRAEIVGKLAAGPVDLAALGAGAAPAVKALEQAGLVVRGTREVVRDSWGAITAAPEAPLPPTPGQAAALETLAGATGWGAYLLHGVTGSGKTEVYLQAIARVLERGGGALVLVPEIALTPQLAARFRARFGDQVAVLHSGLSDGERFDQWRRLRGGAARIALGARSAVFAPVPRLGIVVVDEEHDPSFKQEDGVRYHARDVALMRARRAGAVCVLGSATPSLESYANAKAGRFGLIELADRAHARPLPEVAVVDLKTYRPDGEAMLTAPLATAIAETLAAGEQVVLFLNRRGFATFVLCTDCGHTFRCAHCSVSLTYHRLGERLRCHYCGHSEHLAINCPKCHSGTGVKRLGLGTERIEAALKERFPKARVARLDRDTAEGAGLRDVLGRVAAREVDILVGTQMVTKGHDFPGVTLVGVLCADTGLGFQDFRASERTFQILTQVAGRAGRGDRPGRVVIQTWQPEHYALVHAQTHDYKAFFEREVAERAEHGYPPHGKLIAVKIDGADETLVRHTSEELATRATEIARAHPDVVVRGPAPAPLQRLKGRSRFHLLLGGPDRAALRSFVKRLLAADPPSGVRWTVDVDPMSSL